MPRALLLTVLLLSILARLVAIDGAPVGHHQWRQTDTAGLARNYARAETGFLRPVVDYRGDSSGVAETEFPLYSYLAGQVQRALGLHHWVLRVFSIAGGLATLALAYLLIRLRSGNDVAQWSLGVLALLPLTIFFSRSIQPESWMNAAFLAAIYCMARWCAGAHLVWFIASAVCTALAVLLKLPSLVIGLPLAVLLVERRGWRVLGSPLPWLYAVIALVPPAIWYVHASRLGAETGLSFGILHSDKWGTFAPFADPDWYWNVFVGKIAEDHLAIVGVPLVLLGMSMRMRERSEWVFDAWAIAMLIHILLIPVGHAAHDYYQLPLSVPFAFYIGRFLARARLGRFVGGVRAVSIAGLMLLSGWTLTRLYTQELERPLPDIELAAAIAETTEPDELVIVFVQSGHDSDPTVLYLADRKGWTITPEEASQSLVADLTARGARAAAVSRDIIKDEVQFQSIMRSLGVKPVSDPDRFVLRLGPPR